MKKFVLTIFVLAVALFAFGQERKISGKVTATEDGGPLPGVNVVLKGSTSGAVTDADGLYSLLVPASGGNLVFSFIGLRTQEVAIGERSVVDISLQLDVTQLSEVVVTGVGVATDKRKIGIAVESITADKLPATPTASIDQALVGKIAGAQISSVSGNPGDQANIVLRGINTVQGGTKPLIMIDGIQVSATDLTSLDMSNIDRVEVIQGAASATLYGAQGANGVIQLFTKRGKKGNVIIDVSSSYASNQFLNIGNVRKADKHPYLTDSNNNIVDSKGNILDYGPDQNLNGISYEFGGPARYAIQNLSNKADKPYDANLKYYDHFKQVFKTGYSINNHLSISGANDKTDFALSLSNNKTLSPILQNGSVDRTNLTSNIGTELFKGFKIRSTTQVIYTKNDLHPGLGAAGLRYYGLGNSNGDVGGVYGFLNTSPFFDLTRKDADGNFAVHQQGDGYLSINAFNPYYRKQYATSVDNKIDVIQNFEADYTVNKFLQLNAKYGINYRTENSRWTYANQTENVNTIAANPSRGYYVGQYAVDFNGEIDNWQYNNTFQNFLGTAFIRTDFEEDFNIKLPIQTSTQVTFDYRKRNYKEYDTYGLGLPLAPPINVQSTGSQAVLLDYVEKFVTYGYLINQKIDFGNYGGVTAGFRSDYSSAFGGGSKPFTFPHFDGYVQPLSFFGDNALSNTLPYFKLRAAYGQAGIQPRPYDRYPTLDQRNLGDGLTYATQAVSRNPNLNVEVSTEFEIGTDFTLNVLKGGSPWFNSVNGSFSYWKRSSNDVIYQVSSPLSSGNTDILTNAIDMSANGVQFSLTIPVYASNKIKWDLTTNFGHQISKIDRVKGGSDIILTSFAGSTSLVLTGGQPIGQIYGYRAMTSLDYTRKDGTRYIDPSQVSNYEIVNGTVVDKRTYQIQFTDEQYPLGNPNPKFNMSFINSVSYGKLINLSFQFDWVKGNHLYNQTKEWMYRDGIHSDFTKPVTINGETGAYSAYWSSAYYGLWGSLRGAGNNATKDFFWEDASFVRLRNVAVAFNLETLFKSQKLRKMQLVFTGRNILTWTKYTGYDPEISSGASNSSFDRGVDHSTLPNIKSYQVGLNIGL
jgi:TonB-linked SusC/RagA family outer membrane protein